MVYANSVAQPRAELTDAIVEGVTDDTMFIWSKVLPPYPVDKVIAHVPKIKIDTGNLMRATSKVRSPGANFDRWQSGIEDANLTLTQTSEELVLPDEVNMTYDSYFSLEEFYAAEAANRLKRALELDTAAAIQSTTNFTAANGAVAYSNANLATMTPIADIIAAIRTVKARGERPNTVVIPGIIYDRIRQSADAKSWIAGSINPGARVTQGTLQQSFAEMGITQVLVADAYVNQSQDSTSNSINPIWLPTYLWVGNAAGGELRAGGAGRSFYWEAEGPILNISTYRDEPRKSNVLRGMKTTIEGITNSRAGQLIGTQVTS